MDAPEAELSSSSFQLLEAHDYITNQTLNLVNSMALNCAVQLGIPDAIHKHGNPITLPELVESINVKPDKSHVLLRVMSILVRSGFVVRDRADEKESYSLAPVSRLLLKDEPLNARALLLLRLDPVLTRPWYCLPEWFKNEDPTAFETAHGVSPWECFAQDQKIGSLFNEGMAGDSRTVAIVLVNECKHLFDGLTSLVDVGGGIGTVARAISEAFPWLKCTVFDLGHVISSSKGTENLEFVAGDMFEAIPSANAILLKWILHTWNDEDCVKLLKKCKSAIPGREKGGKLIVIEAVIENETQDQQSLETQLNFDLLMLTMVPSKERTEEQWAKLFFDAGFSDYKITFILGYRSIIEVYP